VTVNGPSIFSSTLEAELVLLSQHQRDAKSATDTVAALSVARLETLNAATATHVMYSASVL
jgi:hypothetical protein